MTKYEFHFYIIKIIILVLGFVGASFSIFLYSRKRKKKIDFDEFTAVEKIKKQDIEDKQKIEYEAQVLNKVYQDTYEKYNKTDSWGVSAHVNAHEAVEKAKKDLYNFEVIDSVEVKKESVKEAGSIKALKENGNTFDVELFKKWARQICGCIKIGTDEQLKVVKNCMSDELYTRLLFQIKEFEKDGLEFRTEDFMIENCKLLDYGKRLGQEEIQIYIDAKMKEYIVRKSDDTVVRGDRNKYFNKKIIMTFIKKKETAEEGLMHNCPNCGAQIIQTDFGNCRYCQTLILPIRYNWTLVKFETV